MQEIYIYTYLSIYLTIYLSIHLSIYLSIYIHVLVHRTLNIVISMPDNDNMQRGKHSRALGSVATCNVPSIPEISAA